MSRIKAVMLLYTYSLFKSNLKLVGISIKAMQDLKIMLV